MPFYVLLGSFAREHSHILILARTVIRSRTHLSVAIPVVRVREGVRAISLGVHSALPVSQCQPTAQMQCQFEGALKIKATQPPAQGPARLYKFGAECAGYVFSALCSDPGRPA